MTDNMAAYDFTRSRASSLSITTDADMWSQMCIWHEKQAADILHNALHCQNRKIDEIH